MDSVSSTKPKEGEVLFYWENMRQIIVLNNTNSADGSMVVNYVYWLTVPVAIRKSLPGFTSLVSDASGSETTALQNGSVLEQSLSATFSPGMSIANVGTYLISRYTKAQMDITTIASIGKNYTGATWDGTTWSNLPS